MWIAKIAAWVAGAGLALAACAGSSESSGTSMEAPVAAESGHQNGANDMEFEVAKSKEEWKKELTEEEYRVLREKGTERPWSGELLKNKETGVYVCAGCGNELFASDTKFDSGTGWPSYYDVVNSEAVKVVKDHSHGMVREEVVCARCGGHLGHVFNDGPNPTGLRYCINSVSLDFEKKSEESG